MMLFTTAVQRMDKVIHTRHTTHTSIFQVHIGMFSHTRHTGHTSKKQVHIEI